MTRVANSSRTTTADRGDTRRKDSEAWEYHREKEREKEREREREREREGIGEPAL